MLNKQSDSGQSSKTVYSPSLMETKPLPPKSQLPLRKRLTAPSASPKAEYPPTPGSHSSSGSSDSTIPLVHSPPMTAKKQPLKKSYTWISTRGKTTVLVNNTKTLNNVGLPGNPLLWNNGNKYEPEDTIDSFKMAWLKDDEDIPITEEEEEEIEEPVKKIQPIAPVKKTSASKRGRPPLSKSSSLDKDVPMRKSSSHQKHTNSQDGKLYCTCRQPYDASRFMIACDRCDDWFHGECIGINEKESEFIDLYFCSKCSKITKKTTSWKPKCANPNCFKAARIGINLGYLSKYCSDSCGMQVARARLELAEIKRRNNQPQSSSEPIAQLALKKQRGLRVHSFADKQDRRRLLEISQEKRKIRDTLLDIYKRHELLQQATSVDDGDVCNFDSRLIYSNTPQICDKIECEQHEQWQKIISLQIDQDKKEQYDLLLGLEKERKLIKARIRKRRDEYNVLEDDFLINTTVEAT